MLSMMIDTHQAVASVQRLIDSRHGFPSGAKEKEMSQALRKRTKMSIPARGQEVIRARPTSGDHKEQVEDAFERIFARYEKAFEDLSKV